MPKNHQSRMPFQLEVLETRTLLAGDMTVIVSTGSFLTNFEEGIATSKVTIASVEGGQLTIDAALLPDTVKELTIRGFTNVTITGADGFEKLDLSQIGSFSGEQINVTAELRAKNVGSLTLNSIAGMARLYGSETRLDVVDARSATILSDVEKLVVSSSNHMGQLWATDAEHQELRFEFSLDQFADEAALLEFLEQFKDRSDIWFLDSRTVYPEKSSPPPSNPNEPDNPGRPDGSSYIVIIISVSSANGTNPFVARLQDALKTGDIESVKSALSAYLNNTSMSEPPDQMSYLGAEFAHAEFEDFDRTTQAVDFSGVSDSANAAETPAHGLSSAALEVHISIATPAPRLVNTLGENFAGRLSPDDTGTSPIDTPSSRANSVEDTSLSHAQNPEASHDGIIEAIRSRLSSLVPGVSLQTTTVSNYIIDRLGYELEPGVLPALLVDAKSLRSRRDFGWTQL